MVYRTGSEPTQIAFRDFVPVKNRKDPAGLDHGDLHTQLEAANKWIRDQLIAVVNVETLLMPSLPADAAAASRGLLLQTSGWYQVLRVWYHSQ